MAEKSSKKPSDSIIKMDITLLKIIGIIKYVAAGLYAFGFIVLFLTGKMPEVINEAFKNANVDNNLASIVTYCAIAAVIIFNIILGVLCFRAIKPGAKPTALMVISMLLFLSTAFTYTGNIFDGSLDWGKFLPEIVNLTAFGCAFQIRKYNKQDQ